MTTAEPFVNYAWSNGTAAAAVYVNQAGTYAVTVTDENGCVNTVTTEVSETNFTFSAVGEDPSCADDTDGAVFIQPPQNGTPPYLFSLNGGAFVADTVLSNLPSGIYQITAEDAAGCTGTFSITLQNPLPLDLNLPTEANLTLGDSLRIDLQNAAVWQSVQWTPPAATSCDTCLQTWLRPTRTTRYTVTVADAGGCTDTQSILLTVDKRLDLYAPTAFSPDNNGINDIFYLQSKNDLPVEQIQIFDRWGNLHFSSAPGYTNDPRIGWDGTVRNGIITQGVYVWTARVVLPDGEQRFLSGEVSVL